MPPKPALALPRTLQVTLRANRDPHPGITEKDKKPRRTSEQVAAEKEQKLQEKLSKAQKKEDTIKNAAHLEDVMDKEDKLRLLEANHPPPNSQKKVARSQRPTQAMTEAPTQETTVDPPTDDDMYVPVDENPEDGSEDEVLDKSDDDDAPRPKKKVRGELRKQVEAARTPAAPSTDVNKRKASVESLEAPTSETTRKKPKKVRDGLRNDWSAKSSSNDDEDRLLTGVHPSHHRSVSASSGMSISSVPGLVDIPRNSGGEESDVDQAGGVSDDAGELVERRGLAEKSKASLRYGVKNIQVKPLAKIVPTTSVPCFVPPTPGARRQFKRKEDVRLSDLPPDLQHNFDAVFSPQLREHLGYSETPWDPPTKTAIVDLWKQAFPTVPLQEDGFLYHVVTKLIDDRVSSWRNKFAKGAVDYLSKVLFPQLPENTKEHRAVWCTWAISGSDRQQPYYYLAYEDAEEGSGGNPVTKGIFQSAIISAVLGLHFSSISQISPARRSTNKPVGALVLTIQAIKRAIGFYITGEEVKAPRPVGDFSRDNWGDAIRRREGKEHKIKTTSSIVKVVLKLSDKQWEKILGAAVSSSKQKRATISAPAPLSAASDTESDFELVDDDEDLLED